MKIVDGDRDCLCKITKRLEACNWDLSQLDLIIKEVKELIKND